MSDNKVLLSRSIATKMENANKKIEKNERGDYIVVVGAVNHFNKSGEFYSAKDVQARFFEANSMLMQRCKNGDVKIEDEHPIQKPEMSKREWFERLYSYDKLKIAGIITELWLEEIDEKENGTDLKIILIKAAIKPLEDREIGLALKRDLENPDLNTSFSIRSIIIKETVNFTTVCKIEDIITFDWVSSGGIKKANTYYTAGMENNKKEYSIKLANLDEEKDVLEVNQILTTADGLESASITLDTNFKKEMNGVISKKKFMNW